MVPKANRCIRALASAPPAPEKTKKAKTVQLCVNAPASNLSPTILGKSVQQINFWIVFKICKHLIGKYCFWLRYTSTGKGGKEIHFFSKVIIPCKAFHKSWTFCESRFLKDLEETTLNIFTR